MKWFVMVLMIVVIGGVSLGSIPWSPDSWNPVGLLQPVSSTLLPDIRAQRIQVMAQTDSAASWIVTAEEAAFYSEKDIIRLDRVSMQYFRHSNPLLQMTAAQGNIDNATGDISVEGMVSLNYHDTYTIETEKMHWRALDRILYTDVPVQIHNPLVRLAGRELRGEVDQRVIALRGNVRASFQLP